MIASGNLQMHHADNAFFNNLSTLDIQRSRRKVPSLDVTEDILYIKVQVKVKVVNLATSKIEYSASGSHEIKKKSTANVLGIQASSKDLFDHGEVNNILRVALINCVSDLSNNLFPLKIATIKKTKVGTSWGQKIYSLILGRSVNFWIEWKDKNANTLSDNER